MTTSPTPSVAPTSGPVQLPDLSLSAYRGLVAELQALRPANADRIARGLTVLLTADIFEAAHAGEYLIQSCRERGTLYRTTGLSCTCPDRQRHPDQQCKHNIAVELLCSASALARCDRWELTEAGAAALATA